MMRVTLSEFMIASWSFIAGLYTMLLIDRFRGWFYKKWPIQKKDTKPKRYIMSLDLCFHHDQSTLMVAEVKDDKIILVEVKTYNQDLVFSEIQDRVRQIAAKYGITQDNFIQDVPRGFGHKVVL